MKLFCFSLFAVGWSASATAGVLVFDAQAFQQRVWQAEQAHALLHQTTLMAARLGDPARVTALAGEGSLRPAATPEGAGQAPAPVITGASGLAYDGGGLFRPVAEVFYTPDGREVRRNMDDYKKFSAVQQAAANYRTVRADTEARRTALLTDMQITMAAVRAATTQAEVQKHAALLTAQTAALQALTGTHDAALGQVVAQGAELQADAARQQQAAEEERASGLARSQARVMELLLPDSNATPLPAPQPRN